MKGEIENLAYDDMTKQNCEFRKMAKLEWTELSDGDRELWVALAREHDEIQPYIRELLVDAINDDPNKSLERLSADIGYWCSASTIHRWLQQYPDYKTYVSRLLPNLSDEQKKSISTLHSTFAHAGISRPESTSGCIMTKNGFGVSSVVATQKWLPPPVSKSQPSPHIIGVTLKK
jgi:hypothetical protein